MSGGSSITGTAEVMVAKDREEHAALAADTGKTRMMLRRPDWLLQPLEIAVL